MGNYQIINLRQKNTQIIFMINHGEQISAMHLQVLIACFCFYFNKLFSSFPYDFQDFLQSNEITKIRTKKILILFKKSFKS